MFPSSIWMNLPTAGQRNKWVQVFYKRSCLEKGVIAPGLVIRPRRGVRWGVCVWGPGFQDYWCGGWCCFFWVRRIFGCSGFSVPLRHSDLCDDWTTLIHMGRICWSGVRRVSPPLPEMWPNLHSVQNFFRMVCRSTAGPVGRYVRISRILPSAPSPTPLAPPRAVGLRLFVRTCPPPGKWPHSYAMN